jgi:hypothetical protein
LTLFVEAPFERRQAVIASAKWKLSTKRVSSKSICRDFTASQEKNNSTNFSLVIEFQMSTDNLKNPRGKKASPIETNPPEIPETTAKPVEDDAVEPDKDQVSELRQMFDKLFFATSAQSDRIHNEVLQIKSMQARQRDEVSDLKSSLIQMSAASSPDSTSYRPNNTPKKSSFFFGTPELVPRPSIQVLQTDIVYDKELKVSSLEGLQYLAKQLQLLSSKYPGREIKLSHMVSFSLRPHVVAAWNSHCHQESLITGSEPEEILVENWLSLSNETVQAILIEAARPRTRELYSRDLVLFLGKSIPQSPPMNTDNFKSFYPQLMKTLNDLVQLHDLLSEETSKFSNNKAKMPPAGYGTKESPGHIALWLISLGSQKDSVMQWLGKDNLSKYKTLDPAVKFIRAKLMEGRSQSEARMDFDAKLTPIRYEDVRHTQGESNTRMQTPSHGHHISSYDSSRSRHQSSRVGFSAIDLQPSSDKIPGDYNTQADNDTDEAEPDFTDPDSRNFVDSYDNSFTQSPPTPLEEKSQDVLEDTYAAMTDSPSARNAIAATYRGYCSELFVFGTCHRRDSGCPLDHSAAGQERCIQSFTLLAKRELTSHSKLPPWAPAKPVQSSFFTPRPTVPASRQDQRPSYHSDPRTETRYPRTSNSYQAQTPNRHPGASAPSRSFSK